MADLVLPLKGIYFDQIASGEKREEFRLVTPFWRKRLEGRAFDRIILSRGYPRADDRERRLYREWRGYLMMTLQHEHFGPEPVEVFAIDVSVPAQAVPVVGDDRG